MKPTNRQGFTLIELSIVLVILGLIVGTVTPLIISITKKNKLTSGRQVVATARDEIKGDFIQTRMLVSDLSSIGHTIDPWQNDLVYIPAPNLSGVNLCNWLAEDTDQTGLAVCLNGDCTNNKKENVAFIIASIGHNFNRQLEALTNGEVRLYGYGTEIDSYATDFTRATDQFDDIVEYVTVDELTQLINCSVIAENQTGYTICSGGAAIENEADIGVLNFNQWFSLGSTDDDCTTINSSCDFDYNEAQLADSNLDGIITVTSVPPGCALFDN